MRQQLGNATYTGIAWAPVLVVLLFAAIALYGGVAQLEARTHGTEYIVPHDSSPIGR